jgi:dihydrodipicolinate synthase/N-acetylneuraminate lyase
MQAINAPRGLIVDLLTPLGPNGDIDGHGLARLLDRVTPHAQGVLIAGPYGGEGRALDLDRRTALFETVLVVIRSAAPILVWITEDTEEKTRQTLLRLKGIVERRRYGGPVFWVDAPLVYHSNRGLPAYYRDLAQAAGAPIILFNDPYRIREDSRALKRANIRTSVLKALSAQEGIEGLVFLGTLDRAHHYHKACRARTGFRIYDGDEGQFLDHPSMGGVLSVGANLSPEVWKTVVEASLHLNPDRMGYPSHIEEIWRSGQFLRQLMDTYRTAPAPTLKRILKEMGVLESDRCLLPAPKIEPLASRLREVLSGHTERRR